MIQRGRKSAASLAVVDLMSSVARVPPPSELTAAERNLWLATVNSKPAEWFGDEHVPMLVEYVRHVSSADMLTKQIQEFEPEWMKDDDGVRRLKNLMAMRAREAQCIVTFARSMRLTQQSSYDKVRAASAGSKVTRSLKPWQKPDEP